MVFLLSILICGAFACIWYLPLFLKHRKVEKEKKRYYLFAFLLGIASVFASVLFQLVFGIVLPKGRFSGVWAQFYAFFRLLVSVGIVEEMSKFLLGILVIRKIPELTEAGCMLIMGMVGLGFECFETLMGVSSPVTTIFRCILAMHIVFQLYMGIYWHRAMKERTLGNRQNYKKLMARALLVPIIVHTVFDYLALTVGKFAEVENVNIALPLSMSAALIVIGLGFFIITLVKAYRTIREEKEPADPLKRVAFETVDSSGRMENCQ